MTMEQRRVAGMRSQLFGMGYDVEQVDRVVNAGLEDISQAIDFLSRDPSPPPETNQREYPSLPSQAATSASSSAATHRTLTNARDSLDRIEINRGRDGVPGHMSSNAGDEALRMALEISSKEKLEADMKKAMLESKKDEEEAEARRQSQDPEYDQAVRESLKDDPRLASDRAVSWQPHSFADAKERVRKAQDEPVGLKNIGNTCYLNSLLQVYYHLPDFRRAIMEFRAPEQLLLNCTVDRKGVTNERPAREPTVETPEEERDRCESPEERLERKISESQPDQSFGPSTDVDLWMKPIEGTVSADDKRDESEAVDLVRKAVEFVVELQRLFASMALGNQNCVDPSRVAHAMHDSDGKPIVIGAQQDASEFNHLFLDIVERGIRSKPVEVTPVDEGQGQATASESMGSPGAQMDDTDDSDNIVKDMFTIHFRQETRRFSNKDTSASDQGPPVTINGETNAVIVDATGRADRDLHSGLDDYAYAQIDYRFDKTQPVDGTDCPAAEIKSPRLPSGPSFAQSPRIVRIEESSNTEAGSPAVKTVWFTRMPPVVVIYLQRVVYNRETSQAEKVNDPYDFTTGIAMDRYMEQNRDAASKARRVVLNIKEQRKSLRALLNRYEMFPDGEKASDETLKSNGMLPREVLQKDHADKKDLSTPCTRPNSDSTEKRPTAEDPHNFFSAARRVQARLVESLNPSSPHFKVDGVSQEAVQNATETLRAVIEQDCSRCKSIREKLETLVDEEVQAYEGLDQVKYSLHAVLVHNGAPSGGHYWTFIRNWEAGSSDLKWMKLSDSAVTYVSEEEMLQWSTGGKSRASAYCLIYAAESTLDSRYKAGMQSVADESRNLLPPVRIEEVELASAQFQKEVQEQEQSGTGR